MSLFEGPALRYFAAMLKPVTTDIEALKILEERLRWLSAWTIHHANHIRESDDGLKVGGHQASSASMTAIMTAQRCSISISKHDLVLKWLVKMAVALRAYQGSSGGGIARVEELGPAGGLVGVTSRGPFSSGSSRAMTFASGETLWTLTAGAGN